MSRMLILALALLAVAAQAADARFVTLAQTGSLLQSVTDAASASPTVDYLGYSGSVAFEGRYGGSYSIALLKFAAPVLGQDEYVAGLFVVGTMFGFGERASLPISLFAGLAQAATPTCTPADFAAFSPVAGFSPSAPIGVATPFESVLTGQPAALKATALGPYLALQARVGAGNFVSVPDLRVVARIGAVPEPASLLATASGLLVLGLASARRPRLRLARP